MKKTANKLTPIWVLIAVDVLALAALLLGFAYFHHVREMWGIDLGNPEGTTSEPIMIFTKPTTPTSTTTSTPTTTVTTPPDQTTSDDPANTTVVTDPVTPPVTEPVYDTSGQFGASFPEVFAQGDEVEIGEDYYRSHDIYLKLTSFDGTIKQKSSRGSTKTVNTEVKYYMADIYVRNVENLFTTISNKATAMENLLAVENPLFAVSGDYYSTGTATKEVIVRNGEVIRYKDYISRDICVLYWDGTMETITPAEYDWDKIAAKGPYQIWSFGPELLNNDGSAKVDIQSDVWGFNPRSAIGYVEPGHYVLIAVHGTRKNTSEGKGVNLDTLAQILSDAGCKQAYNFDGGQSVHGYYNGDMIVEFDPRRNIVDIICIGEVD